jgi:hypothetical protein
LSVPSTLAPRPSTAPGSAATPATVATM